MPDKISTVGGMANDGNVDAGNDFIGRDRNDNRWDNRRGMGGESNVNVNLGDGTQRHENGSRVERALWGDTYTGYPGLIKEVHDLKQAFDDFVRADVNSQRTWITPNVAVLFLALAVAILLLGFYGITVYGK